MNLNPSEASTNAAKPTCATVFSFEAISGFTGIGMSRIHDRIIAPTIMKSRDTTRKPIPREIDRDQTGLVGDRVEQRTKLGRHVEALGKKPVDGIAQARHGELHDGHHHL